MVGWLVGWLWFRVLEDMIVMYIHVQYNIIPARMIGNIHTYVASGMDGVDSKCIIVGSM